MGKMYLLRSPDKGCAFKHNNTHTDTGTETQRHRDTETQRHRDTETQRHRDTETQRHRSTETHRQTQTQAHPPLSLSSVTPWNAPGLIPSCLYHSTIWRSSSLARASNKRAKSTRVCSFNSQTCGLSLTSCRPRATSLLCWKGSLEIPLACTSVRKEKKPTGRTPKRETDFKQGKIGGEGKVKIRGPVMFLKGGTRRHKCPKGAMRFQPPKLVHSLKTINFWWDIEIKSI